MPFPFARSFPVFVYDVLSPANAPPDGSFNIARFRDLAHGRLLETMVPPTLDSSEEYSWGWAWPDNLNPTSVGRWISWTLRAYVKRPPRKLVEAMVEARVQEKLATSPGFKVDKEWRQLERDDVEQILRIKMPPNIEEDQIVYDTAGHRLILFTRSERNRSAITERLRRLLEPMLGEGLQFLPWDLERYLTSDVDGTRAQAVLPQEYDVRFLSWLATQALHRRWVEIAIADRGEPLIMQVTLDGNLKVMLADGEMSVSGDRAAESIAGDVESPDTDVRASRAKFFLRVRGGRSYTVTVNARGELVGAVLNGCAPMSRKESNLEQATLDRADDALTAAGLLRMLYAAFDYGPLSEWMEALPQQQMFAGAATGRVIWHDEDVFESGEPTPDDSPQENLFGDSQANNNLIVSLLRSATFDGYVREARLDLNAARAWRDAHEDDCVAWYRDGGWAGLVAELEKVSPGAKTGAKTKRRSVGETATPVATPRPPAGDIRPPDLGEARYRGPYRCVVTSVTRDDAVLTYEVDELEVADSMTWQDWINLPATKPDIDYSRTWEQMLMGWRVEVGNHFNLSSARNATRSQRKKKPIIDGFLFGGWPEVRARLQALDVRPATSAAS